MKLLAAAFALALLSACDGAALDAPAPCPCEVHTCSAAACGFRVELGASCAGEVELAEVLVGAHLEASTVAPGGDMLACSRIEPGEEATIWVRGGAWAWGPVTVACQPPGGQLHTLTFDCEAGQG